MESQPDGNNTKQVLLARNKRNSTAVLNENMVLAHGFLLTNRGRLRKETEVLIKEVLQADRNWTIFFWCFSWFFKIKMLKSLFQRLVLLTNFFSILFFAFIKIKPAVIFLTIILIILISKALFAHKALFYEMGDRFYYEELFFPGEIQ